MTAPSPADLRALAERYQALRAEYARQLPPSERAWHIADDLADAVVQFLDPAHGDAIIAAQLRREITEREASLALVLARGVSDAVEVGTDV